MGMLGRLEAGGDVGLDAGGEYEVGGVEPTNRCECPGEERQGAKRRAHNDVGTRKYDVQRQLASLVADAFC